MTIVFVGIDLANNKFAMHGVDEARKTGLMRLAVRRDQLLEAVAQHRICHLVMPALMGQGWTCAGSARLIQGGDLRSDHS